MTSTSPAQRTTDPPPDPRPLIRERAGAAVVVGVRCTGCALPCVEPVEVCPECRGGVRADEFGPAGTVFAGTVMRLGLPGRTPPYGLAYVDLDAGPRILAHGYADPDTHRPFAPGARVRLVGSTEQGDPQVEPERTA